MLLDDVVPVVVHAGAGHDAHLGAAVHHLLVDVIAGRCVLDVNALLLHLVQAGGGSLIDLLGIHIHILRQVDLGAVNAHEGIGVVLHIVPGLLGVHNIIGQRGHLVHQLGDGAHGTEGAYNSHCLFLLLSDQNVKWVMISTISAPMRFWASPVAAPIWGVQETMGWL